MNENERKNCNGYEAMFTFLNEEDFKAHLEVCEECKKEHERMQKVSALIQEAKPYIKNKHRTARILVIAASFFLAVFATLGVPLCMVGVDVYDNMVSQNNMDIQDMGLPVDEYGLLYIE